MASKKSVVIVQEWFQKNKQPLPEYNIEWAGNQQFTCKVTFGREDKRTFVSSRCSSKAAAKEDAATKLLDYLTTYDSSLPISPTSTPSIPSPPASPKSNTVSQLKELCEKRRLAPPVYNFEEKATAEFVSGKAFRAQVVFGDKETATGSWKSSKALAKADVAAQAVELLMKRSPDPKAVSKSALTQALNHGHHQATEGGTLQNAEDSLAPASLDKLAALAKKHGWDLKVEYPQADKVAYRCRIIVNGQPLPTSKPRSTSQRAQEEAVSLALELLSEMDASTDDKQDKQKGPSVDQLVNDFLTMNISRTTHQDTSAFSKISKPSPLPSPLTPNPTPPQLRTPSPSMAAPVIPASPAPLTPRSAQGKSFVSALHEYAAKRRMAIEPVFQPATGNPPRFTCHFSLNGEAMPTSKLMWKKQDAKEDAARLALQIITGRAVTTAGHVDTIPKESRSQTDTRPFSDFRPEIQVDSTLLASSLEFEQLAETLKPNNEQSTLTRLALTQLSAYLQRQLGCTVLMGGDFQSDTHLPFYYRVCLIPLVYDKADTPSNIEKKRRLLGDALNNLRHAFSGEVAAVIETSAGNYKLLYHGMQALVVHIMPGIADLPDDLATIDWNAIDSVFLPYYIGATQKQYIKFLNARGQTCRELIRLLKCWGCCVVAGWHREQLLKCLELTAVWFCDKAPADASIQQIFIQAITHLAQSTVLNIQWPASATSLDGDGITCIFADPMVPTFNWATDEVWNIIREQALACINSGTTVSTFFTPSAFCKIPVRRARYNIDITVWDEPYPHTLPVINSPDASTSNTPLDDLLSPYNLPTILLAQLQVVLATLNNSGRLTTAAVVPLIKAVVETVLGRVFTVDEKRGQSPIPEKEIAIHLPIANIMCAGVWIKVSS